MTSVEREKGGCEGEAKEHEEDVHRRDGASSAIGKRDHHEPRDREHRHQEKLEGRPKHHGE